MLSRLITCWNLYPVLFESPNAISFPLPKGFYYIQNDKATLAPLQSDGLGPMVDRISNTQPGSGNLHILSTLLISVWNASRGMVVHRDK